MFALGFAFALFQSSAEWPRTRAELTNFTETSSYQHVVEFIRSLQMKGAPVRLQWMGESTEGRKMPLLIASRPANLTPQMAKRSGRPVIYIQANIHAGEVEGKEAALALLRDWSAAPRSILDKAVVLVAPIYNIDGNEKWGPVEKNRPEQDGPAQVGVRPNGQGFDLNRDCIKAESPEMRGVLERVYKAWDPDVVMDLHTTDGTRHGFELTYAPPLNPNTDQGVMRYAREELLPHVRKQFRSKFGQELFDYGNAERRGDQQAWYSFEPFGRYVTNYAGLRNRIGILSEATTYIPFRDRVIATERFVQLVMDHVAKNAGRVVELTRRADEQVINWGLDPQSAPALGVLFEFQKGRTESVPLEKLAAGEAKPLSGRPKQLELRRMDVFDRFKSTRQAKFPAGYAWTGQEKLVQLLRRHGIVVERLLTGLDTTADSFAIDKMVQADRPYQDHRLIRLEGRFNTATQSFDVGSYLVRTAQPLGALAFYMLEPECLDGAAAWEYLTGLRQQEDYPIFKLRAIANVSTEAVP